MAFKLHLSFPERLKPRISNFFAEWRTGLNAPKRELKKAKKNNKPCVQDKPSGLLTIPVLQYKLKPSNLGNFIMHRALVSAILAGLIASAHAHPTATPYVVKSEAVTPATLQKTSNVVKVRSTPETFASPTIKGSTSPVESGWRKYGTLLATIIIMCAIALRRQRLGRP